MSGGAHQVGRTGRAPSGNLRQFGLMKPEKFWSTYDDVMAENNDVLAMSRLRIWALRQENVNTKWMSRTYQPVTQPVAAAILVDTPLKPDDVPDDIWTTLCYLAGGE